MTVKVLGWFYLTKAQQHDNPGYDRCASVGSFPDPGSGQMPMYDLILVKTGEPVESVAITGKPIIAQDIEEPDHWDSDGVRDAA